MRGLNVLGFVWLPGPQNRRCGLGPGKQKARWGSTAQKESQPPSGGWLLLAWAMRPDSTSLPRRADWLSSGSSLQLNSLRAQVYHSLSVLAN